MSYLGFESLPLRFFCMGSELNTYHHQLKPGISLVAKPELLDPNFLMTVTYICEHNSEGSFGLTLNRRANVNFNVESMEISPERSQKTFPVYIGGPVQLNSLFFLFRSNKEYERSIYVDKDIFLGANEELLDEIISSKNNDIMLFLGCSGWSFYQLDCEVSSGSWFTHFFETDFIFSSKEDGFWLQSLGKIGPEFKEYGENFLDNFK